MNSHSKYTSKDVVIKYINHNPDVFTSYNDIYTIFLQDQKTQKIFEKPIIETFLTIDFQNVIDRTAIIVENSAGEIVEILAKSEEDNIIYENIYTFSKKRLRDIDTLPPLHVKKMLRTIEIKNEKVSEHVELIYKNLTGAIKYDFFEKRPESPFSISEVNTILVANKAYHVWKRNHITPDFDDKVSFLFHACFEYLGDFLDSKIHIDGSVNWDDYDLVSPHQHLDSQYGLHKTIEHMLQNQVVDALKAKRLHKSLDTNSDPDFDLSNSVEKECGYDIETIKRFMAILGSLYRITKIENLQ